MRIPRSLIALSVTLVLGLTLGGPTAVADPPGPPNPPGDKASAIGQDHRADQAEAALAEVEALLNGRANRASGAARHAAGRSLTLALRDLMVLRDALPADARARADRVLARPGASKRSCTKFICVHYTRTGPHRPNLRDRNDNRVPDYIDSVRKTVHAIHVKYKKAGYRSPLADGGRGGDKRTDIYIRDIGSQGIYGYCTSDDPNGNQDYALWAYCVLDNNYSKAEFPTNSPIENMRVTAAHEYFHAVQYAYDAFEDGWLLESTAAWIEDEVFDTVNDNRQYLARSPMSNPEIPIDFFETGGVFHYGTWIFWRYLTEQFPGASAGLPTLVRDVWRRADGRTGAVDEYSLQALETVLAARGTGLVAEFASFASANRHPAYEYEEGGAYPVKVPDVTRNLSPVSPGPVATSRSLDHLTSSTVRFVPSAGMSASNWQLTLDFNLASSVTRPAVIVTRFEQDCDVTSQRVTLDATGAGSVTLPFSVTTYEHVEVTMLNVSNRTTCWQSNQSPFSCLGIPTDENQVASVTGTASQS